MKRVLYLFLVLILSGCIARPAQESTQISDAPYAIKPADNPYAPKSKDSDMRIGGVILTSLDLTEQTENTPIRVKLNFLGSLPRACNELRMEVADPNEQYQILITVYSLVDPNENCENVFQQFETSILLGVYSAGRYTVWVNGGLVGDFVTY